jgi:hypothetical protein
LVGRRQPAISTDQKKGLQLKALFNVWLPDPDSNQGPIV